MRLWHCKSRITVLGEKWSETDDTFSWLCKRIFNSRCRIRIKWEKPPFFHHCGLTACFTASRQCCLSSPCLDHRAASHSRGEGAPPLAGASLCLHTTSHPEKGGTKPDASSDEADPPGASLIYGISHSRSQQAGCLLRSRLGPFPPQV